MLYPMNWLLLSFSILVLPHFSPLKVSLSMSENMKKNVCQLNTKKWSW